MIPKSGILTGGLVASFLTVLSCLQSANAFTIADLTGGYDIFVNRDAVFNGVHMHGATAVGGNLTLQGGGSTFLSDNVARPAGLAVGGSITQNADAQINNAGKLRVGSLQSGQTAVVDSGNRRFLRSASGRTIEFHSGQSQAEIVTAPSFNMTASFNQLSNLSATLAGMTETFSFASLGTDMNNANLRLGAASTASFDVMNITGAQLASIKGLNFSQQSKTGQKLVINVNLSGYTGGAFTQNRNGNDATADNILWNFYGATNLAIQNQFYGSILATGMNFTHENNDIKGSVIAGSFVKNGGQVHVHPFSGNFPTPAPAPPINSVPDAGSTGLLGLLALSLLAGFRRWAR